MSASNSAPACRTRQATAGRELRPSLSASMAHNRAAIFGCPPANPEWILSAAEIHVALAPASLPSPPAEFLQGRERIVRGITAGIDGKRVRLAICKPKILPSL